jgi:nicotinamide-nucleotide amidase
MAMAEGARRSLGSDVGLAVTGVAGPEIQDDQPVGRVFIGVALLGASTTSHELTVPGDRPRIRQYAAISALDALRKDLLASS